ncbi:hypothetical protein C0993_008369, partial [Termitomyces sp. T159_Od127]
MKLVQQSSIPDFNTVVADQRRPIFVGPRYTVRRVAQIMKYQNASAVCIVGHGIPDQNGSRALLQILGLCAPKDLASHFIEFGTVGSKSGISRVMKNNFLKIDPSISFDQVAKRMLSGSFSDSLVEKMEGAPSIVSMLTMSTAMIFQGDQYPHRHMNTTFHKNAIMAEAKKRISLHNNRSLSPKVNLSRARLEQKDNADSGSTVTVAGAKVPVGHVPAAAKDNDPRNHEAPPDYILSVSSIDTRAQSLLDYPLRGHQALLDLKRHYDMFSGYLPLKDRSVGHVNQPTAQHRIVALCSVQVYELSTDVYDELLRRQKAWRDEYA